MPEKVLEPGKILDVSIQVTGSVLDADYAIGATVLSLVDTSDFDELGGGVVINGVSYTYSGKDTDNETITLTTGLTAAVVADDRVDISPASEEKWAMIDLQASEDAISARVPLMLYDRLALGVRDPLLQETVLTYIDESGDWVVFDLIGQIPHVDGGYVDPGTLPEPDPPGPTVSSTPELNGGVGVLYVSWAPSAETYNLEVDVHLSTSSGFTPDSTTYIKTVAGSSTTITHDKNGTPVNDPALYPQGTVFFVKLVFHNAQGTASASAQSGGATLRPVDTEDISVSALWAGTVTADRITGGVLNAEMIMAGGKIEVEGAGGETVGLYPDGFEVKGPDALGNPVLIKFPVDGSPNIIAAQTTTSTLVVTEGAQVAGESSVLPDSELRLESSVSPPGSAPTLTGYLTQIGPLMAWQYTAWGFTEGHDGNWYTIENNHVVRYNATTGARTQLGAMIRVANVPINPKPTYNAPLMHIFYSSTRSRYYIIERNKSSDGSAFLNTYDLWSCTSTEIDDPDILGDLLVSNITTTVAGPAIGWDYTNSRLLVADVQSTGIVVRSYTLGLAGSTESVTTTHTAVTLTSTTEAYTSPNPITFIARGSFDMGLDVYVYKARNLGPTAVTRDFRVHNASTLAVDTNRSWPHASGVNGAQWNPTTGYFYLWYGNGNHRFEKGDSYWNGAASLGDRWVAYSWYDSNSTGGLHETELSPRRKITLVKRAKLKVTIDPVPTGAAGTNDPNVARIYVAVQSSDPGPAAGGGAGPWAHRLTLTPPVTSGDIDPEGTPGSGPFAGGATLFSGTNPAAINSEASDGGGSLISLMGDGSGRAGPLVWDDAGELTNDTGWTNMTLSTGSGTGLYRAVVLGALKIVCVQFNVSGASIGAGTATTVVSAANGLPSAYRPSVVVLSGGRVTAGGEVGTLIVNTDGSIQFHSVAAGGLVQAAVTFFV